jgi:putative membrane protein insertion efficiency factor
MITHPTSAISRAAIAIYRRVFSPLIVMLFGPACRFEPSCSNYADEAIARFGIARGGWLTLKRPMRCRPLGGWGYDPVVARRPPSTSGSLMVERGTQGGE